MNYVVINYVCICKPHKSSSLVLVVHVVESPVVVVVGWSHIISIIGLRVSASVQIGNVGSANLVSALEQSVNTIVVFQEVGDTRSKGIDFLVSFINPVVLDSFITLDREDVLIEASCLGADIQHWHSVGVQVHISGVVGEGEVDSSSVQTNSCVPAQQGTGVLESDVSVDSFQVEFPSVAMILLKQVALEDASPFGALDDVPQLVGDSCKRSVQGHVIESRHISSEFLIRLKVELISWGGVNSEVSSDPIEIVAGSG